MAELKHWTERSVDDFLYKIGWDFVAQIDSLIESGQTSQAALAGALGVSKGRVSQVLSNPGNLTLKNIVRYARALGKKVSVVAYDDADPDNHRGPVSSEIFLACWERAGKPTNFFALNEVGHGFVRVGESEEASASTGGNVIEWRETAVNDGVMRV